MGQTYRGGKSGCKMVTLFDSYSYDGVSAGIWVIHTEVELDLATVRYHALGAYAKSVYLVFGMLSCGIDSRLLAVSVLFVLTYIPESWFCLFISLMSRKKMIAAMANKMEAA